MRHRISRRIAIVGATIALALGAPLGVVLAAHFNDVPSSNPFHADIQALADAGVTTGCGGGNFCPSQLVTREQMAAFMNRLGALGPGKTPVVNADKLDGNDASAFYTKAQVNALLSAYVRRSDLGSVTGILRWGRVFDTGASVSMYIDDDSRISPTMSVVRTGTGAYEVRVPGVVADGAYHGIFLTPEQGQTTVERTCKVFQTVSLGDLADTLVIRVRCFDSAGALANSSFHVLVLQ